MTEWITQAEAELADIFKGLDAIELHNQKRVLAAFQNNRVSQRHFAPTSGYGYDDLGRDALDRVFAGALECEDALVRPHFVSGTHTIFTALCGLLEPGDVMLSVTGTPYDTLTKALGIQEDSPCSLKRLGVKYRQIELTGGNQPDIPAIMEALADTDIKVVYLQRSRGYAWRDSLLPSELESAFHAIHEAAPHAAIVVDNCYGEFVCMHEPSHYGADVIIGSLIKNPGGGIAPTGGYIAGKSDLIKKIAQRFSVPGVGREAGSYAASYAPFFQGLFLAPHVTIQALKTAVLFAKIFETLGMPTLPKSASERSDIVQALRLDTKEEVIAICQAMQKAAPVDSFLTTEPWDMPGYQDPVIMASGSFIQGSSIELSADAPIKKPYTVYLQGALTYVHGKLAASRVLAALKELNLINISAQGR